MQGGLCGLCGNKMVFDLGYDESAVLDHVVPLSKGGNKAWDNEHAVHQRCNAKKSDDDVLIYLLNLG